MRCCTFRYLCESSHFCFLPSPYMDKNGYRLVKYGVSFFFLFLKFSTPNEIIIALIFFYRRFIGKKVLFTNCLFHCLYLMGREAKKNWNLCHLTCNLPFDSRWILLCKRITLVNRQYSVFVSTISFVRAVCLHIHKSQYFCSKQKKKMKEERKTNYINK